MLSGFFRYFSLPVNSEEQNEVSLELYPDLKELIALKDRKAHLKLTAEHSIKSTVPGDHHSPFRGQGLEFDSVREYVPGDDVRNIDWRVTARTGSPHMKLFREEREREVIICVDMNADMRFGTRNTFKSVQAARVGAFIGWRSLDEKDRVGACLFGDVPDGLQFFDPKRTRQSLWAMMKLLVAPPKEHHQVILEDVLRHIHLAARPGTLVYVISDFLEISPGLAEIFARLNKFCDVVCISINDPADANIVPVGSLEFQSATSEKIAVNTESLKGRKTYKEQWKENRRQLNEIIVRAKVSMIELTTEMDIHRELLLGMRALSKRRRQR
ncbi:MAG: DUF58 domain-containing protein [Chlamydiota bacterium]